MCTYVKSKPKARERSIDYDPIIRPFRTVNDELKAREVDELLDTADDVRGFLQNKKNRRDIPKYIDRANVVSELARLVAIDSKRVTARRKVDVLGMSYAVVSKAKDQREAVKCLESMLPTVVAQAAVAKDKDVRQAAKNFVRRTLESKEQGESAMEAFARAGVGSEDKATCIECCKAVPDIFDNRYTLNAALS